MTGPTNDDVIVLGEGVEAGGHGDNESNTGQKLFHVEQKGISESVSKVGQMGNRMVEMANREGELAEKKGSKKAKELPKKVVGMGEREM